MTEETDHALVEVVRDGEHAGLDLPEESRHVLVIEGQGAAKKGIEDHAAGPYVHLL